MIFFPTFYLLFGALCVFFGLVDSMAVFVVAFVITAAYFTVFVGLRRMLNAAVVTYDDQWLYYRNQNGQFKVELSQVKEVEVFKKWLYVMHLKNGETIPFFVSARDLMSEGPLHNVVDRVLEFENKVLYK